MPSLDSFVELYARRWRKRCFTLPELENALFHFGEWNTFDVRKALHRLEGVGLLEYVQSVGWKFI